MFAEHGRTICISQYVLQNDFGAFKILFLVSVFMLDFVAPKFMIFFD